MGWTRAIVILFFFYSFAFCERVWVFFGSKGRKDDAYMRRVYDALPYRTKVRRAKVGVFGPTEFDIPVDERYIQDLERMGCRHILTSRWLNAAVFEMPSQLKGADLLRLSFVREVRPVAVYRRKVPEFSPLREPSEDPFYGYSALGLFQLDIEKMHRLGYHGEGVRIGLLDTGARFFHMAFDSLNVVATWDFINNDPDISYDPAQDVPEQPYHGTYTLGVLGAYLPGKIIGVAYKAEFVLAKTEIVNEEIQIEESYWVRGLEWAESLGVDIVSSSLGYSAWYSREDVNGRTAITTRAANIAASLGVLVITSAGNERGTEWNYIIVPADAESVISVGAVDRFGVVASFSSPGPTYDGRIKPELVALGVNVPTVSPLDSAGFATVSGTSMSTPLVAGACALLLQASPHLTPMQIKDTILAFADQFFEPDTDAGWGIPSPYLSAVIPPTLYLKLYDAYDLSPLSNAPFMLLHADTTCTLYTNGRGLSKYFPAQPGEYRVKVEISPNIFFTYNFQFSGSGKKVVRVPVERRFEESVRIYPNPFKDKCTVVFERPVEGTISVYSISGDLLYEYKSIAPIEWAGVNREGERLGSGVYIMVIKYDGKEFVRRVAIVR